jgi:tight adherence protein B
LTPGEAELYRAILLASFAVTLLLGAALFAALRADRRRQNIQQRLQQIARRVPDQVEPAPSLRLAQPRSGLRGLLLLPVSLQRRFDAALTATGNRIGVPHLAIVGAVAGVFATGLCLRLFALGPVVAIVLGTAAALSAALGLLRLGQARYQNRFLEVFPDALDLVARAVRAGLPVFDAMEAAAHEVRDPVGSELRRIIDELRIGAEIEEALQQAAERVRVPDFLFYVVAITLQRRTGGRLAETLANLSNIIRRRREVRLKARALTAEARASAMVLTLLPFFVAAGLVFISRQLMQTLWTDPRGRFMVGIAIVNVLIGAFVMQQMIKRALR